MAEEQSQRLFTKGFTKRVHDAIELNRDASAIEYYHPSEKKVVRKCIDLSCQKPLHAASAPHPSKSSSEEKWLEAYLIQQAKRSNWILELCGRRYQYLYSQLNFRRTELEGPRPLDLLLWEMKTRHLTVLELKAGKKGRRLSESVKELAYYTKRVGSHKHELAEVFDLSDVLGVEGYVIWPSNARIDSSRHDLGDWGFIEYTGIDAPWKEFREAGGKLTIDFRLVKDWGGSI